MDLIIYFLFFCVCWFCVYHFRKIQDKCRHFKWYEWLLLPFLWGGPLGLCLTLLLIILAVCAVMISLNVTI